MKGGQLDEIDKRVGDRGCHFDIPYFIKNRIVLIVVHFDI